MLLKDGQNILNR